MIIDAHNHPDWHGHNLERFLKNTADNNIDVTWLLSWECPPDEADPSFNSAMMSFGQNCPIPFSNCVSYDQRAPGKFVLGYAPDPRRPEAIDQLDAAVSIYKVKVCGELKLRMMYDNFDALRMYRFCAEKKLPVIVHIDYEFNSGRKYPRPNYWYGGGIEAFERAIQACPETIFLGHAPGFWAHISGDDQYNKASYPKGPTLPGGKVVQMLRDYPNLYCDLSAGSGFNALNRDHAFARDFLLEFKDRVLYARDYFDSQHQELLNSLDLPADVLEQIYSGNALRLAPLENQP
ncbi:MAG: amidohydrolase family protein [Armatimonadetes bacterium]|nr:amidohydrolase family protein [Armatimonadota bacterium]